MYIILLWILPTFHLFCFVNLFCFFFKLFPLWSPLLICIFINSSICLFFCCIFPSPFPIPSFLLSFIHTCSNLCYRVTLGRRIIDTSIFVHISYRSEISMVLCDLIIFLHYYTTARGNLTGNLRWIIPLVHIFEKIMKRFPIFSVQIINYQFDKMQK